MSPRSQNGDSKPKIDAPLGYLTEVQGVGICARGFPLLS